MAEPAGFIRDGDVVKYLACGSCNAPLTQTEPVEADGHMWHSWVCANDDCDIGMVATFADFGQLDLGIVRDPEAERRNDFQVFTEEWIGVQQLGERSGPADIG